MVFQVGSMGPPIVDKPYKNIQNLREGMTASEEKGVFRQTGMELLYKRIKRPEIKELFRVGDRSMSRWRRRLRGGLSDGSKCSGFNQKTASWKMLRLKDCPLIHFYTVWKGAGWAVVWEAVIHFDIFY